MTTYDPRHAARVREAGKRTKELIERLSQWLRGRCLVPNFLEIRYFAAYLSAPRKWSDTYGSLPTTQLSCGSGGM